MNITNIIHMSMAAGCLILLIIAVRTLAVHRLPKATFLILWGIVMLRLLMPVNIMLSLPAPHPVGGSTVREKMQTEGMTSDVWAMEQETAEVSSGFSTGVITILWAVGVLVSGLYFGISYLRSVRTLRQSLPLAAECPQHYIDKFPKRHRVGLFVSDRITTPVAYGVFRPKIILPKTMQSFFREKDKMEYVMYHELIHITRYDNLWKLVAVTAVCVHWFNPLVWVMCILFNRDLELSCDEKVLAILGNQEKENYAMTLIAFAQKYSGLPVLYSGFGKNAVKERIAAIMKNKKKTGAAVVAAAVLLLLSISVFLSFREKGVSLSAAETSITAETENAEEDTYILSHMDKTGEDEANYYYIRSGAEEDKSSLGWVKEFEEYGLTIDQNEQLYFKDNPVIFIADNQSGGEEFKGRVYANGHGEGSTGVITVRDKKGDIVGLQELGEEESNQYRESKW